MIREKVSPVAVTNIGETPLGLTNDQLRASAIPVSITTTVGDSTAANQVLEIAQLTAIAAKDFATQTTLALMKAKTDNLDVALSTVATQATLATINTAIGSINTQTATILASNASIDSKMIVDNTGDVNMGRIGLLAVAVEVGSGASSTGTQRVILATDQATLPVSVVGSSAVNTATATRNAPTYVEASSSALSQDLMGNARVVVFTDRTVNSMMRDGLSPRGMYDSEIGLGFRNTNSELTPLASAMFA